MKAALRLLILLASINLASAGDFAGPPPFTNDSPLQSGTDGTYQAIASGVNLTGVFSFVIEGGIQTSGQTATLNSWVFFVDGNIFQGSVTAAISRGKIAGVLNGGVTTLSFERGEALTLPSAFVIPGNTASGEFNGSFQVNSPLAVFEGKGSLEGTPDRTDQLIFLTEPTVTTVVQTGTTTTTTTSPATNFQAVFPINIPGAGIAESRFRFNGTRVSTTPAAVPTPTPSPTPTDSSATTGGTTTGTTTTGTTTNGTTQ
jgi:hypothetical protein